MRLAIGCDHGAYQLKELVKQHLLDKGLDVEDFGCFSTESVDYAEFAFKVGEAVSKGQADKGIVLCTTGIGVSICANKVLGIRCALCSDLKSAKLTRMHNDSNVLALGAGIITTDTAMEIVDVWLATEFEGGRHLRRINKITQYELNTRKGNE